MIRKLLGPGAHGVMEDATEAPAAFCGRKHDARAGGRRRDDRWVEPFVITSFSEVGRTSK
jgi:hypothetical protein